MKKFLITLNVCGEVRMDVVETNFDTVEAFLRWIGMCLDEKVHFIVLTGVSDGIKAEIAIKPQNIEAIMELND